MNVLRFSIVAVLCASCLHADDSYDSRYDPQYAEVREAFAKSVRETELLSGKILTVDELKNKDCVKFFETLSQAQDKGCWPTLACFYLGELYRSQTELREGSQKLEFFEAAKEYYQPACLAGYPFASLGMETLLTNCQAVSKSCGKRFNKIPQQGLYWGYCLQNVQNYFSNKEIKTAIIAELKNGECEEAVFDVVNRFLSEGKNEEARQILYWIVQQELMFKPEVRYFASKHLGLRYYRSENYKEASVWFLRALRIFKHVVQQKYPLVVTKNLLTRFKNFPPSSWLLPFNDDIAYFLNAVELEKRNCSDDAYPIYVSFIEDKDSCALVFRYLSEKRLGKYYYRCGGDEDYQQASKFFLEALGDLSQILNEGTEYLWSFAIPAVDLSTNLVL